MAKIDGPGPRDHAEVGLCYKHAMALQDHKYEKLAQDARPRRAANLEAADRRKDVTIQVDRRERRPDGRQPGRDPTIGLNPPHREPRDPTIGLNPPGYDGGRLVELGPARLTQLGRVAQRPSLKGSAETSRSAGYRVCVRPTPTIRSGTSPGEWHTKAVEAQASTSPPRPTLYGGQARTPKSSERPLTLPTRQSPTSRDRQLRSGASAPTGDS